MAIILTRGGRSPVPGFRFRAKKRGTGHVDRRGRGQAARAAVHEGGVGRRRGRAGRRQGLDLTSCVVRWERSDQRGGTGGGRGCLQKYDPWFDQSTQVKLFERVSKRVTLFGRNLGGGSGPEVALPDPATLGSLPETGLAAFHGRGSCWQGSAFCSSPASRTTTAWAASWQPRRLGSGVVGGGVALCSERGTSVMGTSIP